METNEICCISYQVIADQMNKINFRDIDLNKPISLKIFNNGLIIKMVINDEIKSLMFGVLIYPELHNKILTQNQIFHLI